MDLYFAYFIGMMVVGIFIIISYIMFMDDKNVKTTNRDIFGAIFLVLFWPLFIIIFVASRFQLK